MVETITLTLASLLLIIPVAIGMALMYIGMNWFILKDPKNRKPGVLMMFVGTLLIQASVIGILVLTKAFLFLPLEIVFVMLFEAWYYMRELRK